MHIDEGSPSKVPILRFCPKKLRNALKLMKKQLSDFSYFYFWITVDFVLRTLEVFNRKAELLTINPINDTQTPPSPSELIQFSRKMHHNMLKRMKIQISDYFDYYLLSYGRFCSQFSCVFTSITDQKCLKKCLKRSEMFWNGFLISWFFLCDI